MAKVTQMQSGKRPLGKAQSGSLPQYSARLNSATKKMGELMQARVQKPTKRSGRGR